MSTIYRSKIKPKINQILNLCDMSDGKIREEITDESSSKQRCFTDGKNYVWLYIENGEVDNFVRFGINNVDFMIDLIEFELGYKVYSEHDEEYWKAER